jgi:hypothetical protein
MTMTLFAARAAARGESQPLCRQATAAAGEAPGRRDLNTPIPAAARGDQNHASARVGEADLPALAPRDTLHPRRRVVLSHVRYALVSLGSGLKRGAIVYLAIANVSPFA